jgi:hypothetical protein
MLRPKSLDIKEGDSESHPVALRPWHAKCHTWVTAQTAQGRPDWADILPQLSPEIATVTRSLSSGGWFWEDITLTPPLLTPSAKLPLAFGRYEPKNGALPGSWI